MTPTRFLSTSTSRGGRPTAEAAARLSDTILDAAWRLFVEGGYRALNMDAVAHTARVSKRTIYSRFADKAGLLEAVLVHGIRVWRDQAATVAQAEVQGDWLKALIAHLLKLLASPEIVTLTAFLATEGKAYPGVERAVRMERDAALDQLALFMAGGEPNRLDRDGAAGLLALIQGYAVLYRRDLQTGEAAPLADRLIRQGRQLLDHRDPT